MVSALLAVIMFTVSVTIAMAYGEPGPTASGGTPKDAPICTSEKPQKAWLYRVKSLGKGSYQLYWDKADRANSWTVGYGTQPGKYIYGMSNFGSDQSRSVVINTFSSRAYYFAVKANNGCMPGDWSNEWKVGTSSFLSTTNYVAPTTVKKTGTTVIPTPTTTKPVVTTTPVKGTQPVVTKAPVVNPTTLPAAGGFWGWVKGLFQ